MCVCMNGWMDIDTTDICKSLCVSQSMEQNGGVRKMTASMRRASDLTVEKLIDELFMCMDTDEDGAIKVTHQPATHIRTPTPTHPLTYPFISMQLKEIGGCVKRLNLQDIIQGE